MAKQESLVLRINHDKFLVLFRNAELVSLAEQRLGKVTAQVYGQFLKQIEPKVFRCQNNFGEDAGSEEEDLPKKSMLTRSSLYCPQLTSSAEIKLSCIELSRSFPDDIVLDGSIAMPPKEVITKSRKRSYEDSDDDAPRKNGKLNGKGKHLEDSDEESDEVDEWAAEDDDMDSDAVEKKKRMKLIKQHLLLLAEDGYKFLTSESNKGMGEWTVNYKELGKIMRAIELEKIAEERFESTGTRLLRIIKDKGKLDEKQVNYLPLTTSTKANWS